MRHGAAALLTVAALCVAAGCGGSGSTASATTTASAGTHDGRHRHACIAPPAPRRNRGPRPAGAPWHPTALARARQPHRPRLDRGVRALRLPHLRRRAPHRRPRGDRALRAHRQGEPRVPRHRRQHPVARPRPRAERGRRLGPAARLGVRPARLPARPREAGCRPGTPSESPAQLATALGLDMEAWDDELVRPSRLAQVEAAANVAAVARFSNYPVFLLRARTKSRATLRRPHRSEIGGGVRDGDREGAAPTRLTPSPAAP